MRLKHRARMAARRIAGDAGRGLVRRAQLGLGLRPRVNRAAGRAVSYPGGRAAAVVISADLELAWAWRYAQVPDPAAYARRRAQQGRKNLGVVLDLCDRFDVPVTWATVGHLFLNSCDRSAGRAHPEVPRVGYFQNERWTYRSGDWFDDDPATNTSGPDWAAWYGPDLVRSVLGRRVKHEIGCHTFSHVVFSDVHCPTDIAAAELRCCQEAAAPFGLTLRSFVFPGNLPGNFGPLSAAGFTSYRLGTTYELDVPRRDPLGMWQIPEGVWLETAYASWTSARQAAMVRRYVDTAIQHGLLCSLWFHPETDPRNVEEVFPVVFDHIASRRSEVWVTTMGDLAQWLDTQIRADAAPPTV
jgi:hypothetical protein